MGKVKSALITGFLGETKDRFRSYNAPLSVPEKLKMVASMEDIDGVEMVYPYEVPEASELKSLLSENGLNMAAINVNIKSEPEFIRGGISSEVKAYRDKAVKFIKEAKDYAEAVGADKVQCCPLGDGYEYNFQEDYTNTWNYMKDGFAEAGAYKPEIPLFIEYKPNEVRGKCFLDTAAKTVCMLQQIGNKNIGVTIDFGHSLYGGETPAEALSLIEGSGYPYYVHINDNDRKWDWDYICGSHNFLAYVEFIYYLQKFDYKGYLTSDTSPQRTDIKRTFEANARWTNKIWKIVESMDKTELAKLIAGQEYLDTWKFLEDKLFFRGE